VAATDTYTVDVRSYEWDWVPGLVEAPLRAKFDEFAPQPIVVKLNQWDNLRLEKKCVPVKHVGRKPDQAKLFQTTFEVKITAREAWLAVMDVIVLIVSLIKRAGLRKVAWVASGAKAVQKGVDHGGALQLVGQRVGTRAGLVVHARMKVLDWDYPSSNVYILEPLHQLVGRVQKGEWWPEAGVREVSQGSSDCMRAHVTWYSSWTPHG